MKTVLLLHHQLVFLTVGLLADKRFILSFRCWMWVVHLFSMYNSIPWAKTFRFFQFWVLTLSLLLFALLSLPPFHTTHMHIKKYAIIFYVYIVNKTILTLLICHVKGIKNKSRINLSFRTAISAADAFAYRNIINRHASCNIYLSTPPT